VLWVGVLILGALCCLVFILLHLRPLTPSEVRALAEKWRTHDLSEYLSFSHRSRAVDGEFKRRMAASGRLYAVQEELSAFPSIAASLLKYKKHEWIIIGFERGRSVVLLWMNKGRDNSAVEFLVSIEQIAEIALTNRCSSVLMLHNHPNPDPSRYSASRPSEIDLSGSAERGAHLSRQGLNLIEYVCERGWPHEYRRVVSDAFLPLVGFQSLIEGINGLDRIANLRLDLARLFGRGKYRYLVERLQHRAAALPRSTSQNQPQNPPADWYPDPLGVHQYRYWDGLRWSDSVANNGVVGLQALSSDTRSV
jgi:hypothetical protein